MDVPLGRALCVYNRLYLTSDKSCGTAPTTNVRNVEEAYSYGIEGLDAQVQPVALGSE